jgi:molecular chaperone DnaJ
MAGSETAMNYYELLEVTSDATDDQIKRAFRALARKYHPDANPDDPTAVERFKEINEAYETLRDPERRRRYDMFGPEGGANGGPFGGGSPFDAGAFGLNDLFDAFFGGGGPRGRGPAGATRGPDAETVLDLKLVDVVFGTRTTLDLHMLVGCERCSGSGCAPGTHPDRCPTCEGTGEVRQVRRSLLGQIVTAGPCSACGATGQVIPNPCEVCAGAGRINGDTNIEVDIPQGIDDGQRLRLSGRGPAGPRGGPPGDLYVSVRVARHPELERRGDELWYRLPVSIVQAALGTQIDVATLDGDQEIDVPSGTQPGTLIRLRGLGVPSLRTTRRGDLVVEVRVDVPTRLTDDEAQLLAQFAELRGEKVSSVHEGLLARIRSAFKP